MAFTLPPAGTRDLHTVSSAPDAAHNGSALLTVPPAQISTQNTQVPSRYPSSALSIRQIVQRVFTEGKVTNNKVRLLKAKLAETELKRKEMATSTNALLADLSLLGTEHATLSKKIMALPFAHHYGLEDLQVKSLGPHNNRQAIRDGQDDGLMTELINASRTPLPPGFKAGMFMYAPADVMLTTRDTDRGSVASAALAELNAQSYDGTSTVPPTMYEHFMMHYYRIGEQWMQDHVRETPDKNMLILFGCSGREKPAAENSRGMVDKFVYGTKIGQGAGNAAMTMTFDQALHRFDKEEKKKQKCRRENMPYTPGQYWPVKHAVVVGYNPDFIDTVQPDKNGERKIAKLFGVEVTHVMSDRLVEYLQQQVGGLEDKSFKYCNITMPEGNDKHQTFKRQQEFNDIREEQFGRQSPALNAAGLEIPVLFGTIEKPDGASLDELADIFHEKCVEASNQDVTNGRTGDLVLKSTGTAKGIGVNLIKRDDLDVVREIFKQHIVHEVQPYTGNTLGFPYAIQSYLAPHEVDNKIPEIRVVPHIVEFDGKMEMVACPTIIKTGTAPQGDLAFFEVNVEGKEPRKIERLKKSNVGSNESVITKEMREDRDYLSTLAEAGCNLEHLAKYGVDKEMITNICKYVSGLATHAVKYNIERQQNDKLV